MKIGSRIHATALLAVLALGLALLIPRLGDRQGRPPSGGEEAARPLQLEIDANVPERESAFETIEVRSDVRQPRAYYDESPDFRSAREGFEVTQPATARLSRKGAGFPVDVMETEAAAPDAAVAVAPPAAAAPVGTGQVASFESTDFVDNIDTTGNIFIPADPQGAAGPNHVVSVTNTTLAVHTKSGAVLQMEGLIDFFSALNPVTFTFDPRVTYDVHAGRWLVITDEVTDRQFGASTDTSSLFVAVSDDSDPTGQWTVTEIDAKTSIGGIPHWVDFPQLAVDEEAVYITGTMFRFFSFGNAAGGQRLWIIEKGEGTGGFYDGGTALVDQYNPISGGAFSEIAMTPAMVFGTPGSATFGTYLVGYSGLSNGTEEAVQIIRVNNPLGTPTFTVSIPIVGNIHDTSIFPLPEAPQSGSTVLIRANDSRALKAVWRDDNLWTTFAITPNVGDPERGQAVAHWQQFGVAGSPVLVQQGRVSGEDIAPGTYTFFPSLAVNEELDVMIGFAASGPSIFPGAYYAVHDAEAPAGTVGPSMTLRAGIDYYVRSFNGPLNRWGDFSSVAVDPADQCFWIYNKYATLRGTPANGEDGRWATRFAKFCNAECAGVPDPLTELVADNTPDTTLAWEDLGSGFSYDVVIGTIAVMRADGMVGPAGCLAQQIATPGVVDVLPDPPAGQGRYYIVRPRSVCETGDYGSDSDGVLRGPVPGCPD